VYPSINGYVARHSCPTKEEADAQAFTDRIDCQEIKVKVLREKKQPVVKSAIGKAACNPYPTPNTLILLEGVKLPYDTQCNVSWEEPAE
jgi:hypothetical protein